MDTLASPPRRITPAYAGSSFLRILKCGFCMDHPRIRGEQSSSINWALVRPGSPPHTRGAAKHMIGLDACQRITPAYAGSRSIQPLRYCCAADHPRIRGEQRLVGPSEPHGTGSPPHTRGAGGKSWAVRTKARITPAYAGSRPLPSGLYLSGSDHPRIRGEQDAVANNVFRLIGSPPHTRGAGHYGLERQRRRRITPAYAGSRSHYHQYPNKA